MLATPLYVVIVFFCDLRSAIGSPTKHYSFPMVIGSIRLCILSFSH